jgi:hypothetical protein
MTGSGDKVLRVGSASYVIDEGTGTDIAAIVAQVEQALGDGTVVKVPVLDADKNRMTLYLNGGRVDTVVFDTGDGSRPGVISPG